MSKTFLVRLKIGAVTLYYGLVVSVKIKKATQFDLEIYPINMLALGIKTYLRHIYKDTHHGLICSHKNCKQPNCSQ